MSFLYNYVFDNTPPPVANTRRKMRGPDDDHDNDSYSETTRQVRALNKTFSQESGLFSKLSQIISVEDENSHVYSQCKPMSAGETTNILRQYFETNQKNCREFIESIDYEYIKCGSIGLIFKGVSRAGKQIIFKVKHHGIDDSIAADLSIIERVAHYVYSFFDLNDALDEIKIKVSEELDFVNERKNHEMMYELWDQDTRVIVPQIYSDYCTENILVIEYIGGGDFNDYIAAADQAARDQMARDITRFIFVNLYQHGILYSDIHYGNILVKDGRPAIIDFGCIHKIDQKMLDSFILMRRGIRERNDDLLYKACIDIGLIHEKPADEKECEYLKSYIELQEFPFVCDEEWKFDKEWLDLTRQKDINYIKRWNVPRQILYLCKIPHSMYALLAFIGGSINYTYELDVLLEEIKKYNHLM